MEKRLVVVDTSVLLVWLDVPKYNTCNDEHGKVVGHEEVVQKVSDWIALGVKFVLPVAVIIETGNHIAQMSEEKKRKEIADKFAEIVLQCLDAESPWIAFSNQSELLSDEKLRATIIEWQKTVAQTIEGKKGTSLGDISIKQVAEFYVAQGYEVHIFTGDFGLRCYSPVYDATAEWEVQKSRRDKKKNKG